ncbi:MAG: hypothetical protein HOW73_42825 [Polyangiaceae bacterium]|nr:hypothetical protein [Polyangiaceae bacterium]
MDEAHRVDAERMRALLATNRVSPAAFRAAQAEVPGAYRDAWVDLIFGLGELADDDCALPSGCVPYLPCPVDTVSKMVTLAEVSEADLFVDIGSGVGRTAALTHLLSGASAIGLEVQPHLVRSSRELLKRLRGSRVAIVEGDAGRLTSLMTIGSVFFLYCPFSGARLEKVLRDLERIARARPIRVCCVDLPLPPCPWLSIVASDGSLEIYRSSAICRS